MIITWIFIFLGVLCYAEIPKQLSIDIPYLSNSAVPKTSFTCANKPGNGFYADLETDCKAFHTCRGDRFESFLCPTGTYFSQKDRVCDFSYNVDCSESPKYYRESASEDIHGEDGYVLPPKPLDEELPTIPEKAVEVPVIPVIETEGQIMQGHIPLIQTIEPSDPEVHIPLIPTIEPVKPEIPLIPTIQPVEQEAEIPLIPTIEPAEPEIPLIPIIQPLEPEAEIPLIPTIEPEEISVFKPKPEMHIDSFEPESEQDIAENVESSLPKNPEPLKTTAKPEGVSPDYSFTGSIPEPIAEDMNFMGAFSHEENNFPENNAKPLYGPINHNNALSINHPTSDVDSSSSSHVFNPAQTGMSGHPNILTSSFPSSFIQVPHPHMNYITPALNNMSNLVHKILNTPIPGLHLQTTPYGPIRQQYHSFKPVVSTKPYVFQVPSAQIRATK